MLCAAVAMHFLVFIAAVAMHFLLFLNRYIFLNRIKTSLKNSILSKVSLSHLLVSLSNNFELQMEIFCSQLEAAEGLRMTRLYCQLLAQYANCSILSLPSALRTRSYTTRQIKCDMWKSFSASTLCCSHLLIRGQTKSLRIRRQTDD